MPVSVEELICHPVHDPFVEILASQKRVSGSRENLEDTVVHLKN